MKKVIGVLAAGLLFSSSMFASANKTSSVYELEMYCEAGWRVVEAYYNNGGNDGFVAGQLFDAACNYQ